MFTKIWYSHDILLGSTTAGWERLGAGKNSFLLRFHSRGNYVLEKLRAAYLSTFLLVYKPHQNVTYIYKQNLWLSHTSFSRKLVVLSLKPASLSFLSIKIG